MFFELDNIKRRHNAYWDVYNEGWTPTPDSTIGWNVKRGMMVGIIAAVFQETFTNFHESYRLLMRKYEPPSNLKEFTTAIRAVFNMDNYK